MRVKTKCMKKFLLKGLRSIRKKKGRKRSGGTLEQRELGARVELEEMK